MELQPVRASSGEYDYGAKGRADGDMRGRGRQPTHEMCVWVHRRGEELAQGVEKRHCFGVQ